jgi:catechol 2,3-dioxygenase
MPASNRVLGHIVLNVRDLEQSEKFYCSVLGLRVSARNASTRMTFLSFGREHHDIALQALSTGIGFAESDGAPRVHHFCIYCERNDEIDELHRMLKQRKIPIVSGPETLVVAGNRSISFLDPDGNRLELACNANKFRHDERRKRPVKSSDKAGAARGARRQARGK